MRYQDMARLDEIREEYHANVLVLYHAPEVSDGWRPQGTWEEVAEFVENK